MDESNVALLIELLRQADDKLSRVEQRLAKYDTFIFESAGDRAEIRGHISQLQEKLTYLSELLKKSQQRSEPISKRVYYTAAGTLLAAIFGAGAIDWGKFFESIMSQGN